MIEITIKRSSLSTLEGFTVDGHAGYGKYGEDIVCAAVSILSYTALTSLVEVCEIEEKEITFTAIEESGYLDVNLPKEINKLKYDRSQIVLKMFELGIKSLVESYPKFVTLKYRRCER